MVASRAAIDAAYASCVRDARGHYENFPVASLLVPRALRRDVAAVYAFARAADDFADEGGGSVGERLRLIDGWLERLRQAAASEREGPAARPGEPANAVAIFLALGASIRARALPLAPFEDLLSAFRQDVTVTRYGDWPELMDYCRRSANPVGRLVLRIGGYRDPQLDAWSDAMCTALQLTNFWQDLSVDLARGRCYLPACDVPPSLSGRAMAEHHAAASHGGGRTEEPRSFSARAFAREARFGEPRRSLRRRRDAGQNEAVAGCHEESAGAALASAVDRTRALFDAGRPVCNAVGGRLRYELRATWLGGVRVLERVERLQLAAFRTRPALGPRDLCWIAARLLTWSRQP